MIECVTLEETVSAVQAIPARDRQIIVYTGIHPNEGTTGLARPYEEIWKEYNAIVVAHPSSLTPHAIWRRQQEIHGQFAPLSPDMDIREEIIEAAITQGDPTIFIRFHGTEESPKRKLAITYSMDLSGWLNSELPETLRNRFPGETEYEEFLLPPNRISLEYYYLGGVWLATDPFIAQAIKELDHFYNPREESDEPEMPKIFSPNDVNWQNKGDLNPKYIVQPRPTKADIQAFHQDYSSTLTKLIKHISQFLPTS